MNYYIENGYDILATALGSCNGKWALFPVQFGHSAQLHIRLFLLCFWSFYLRLKFKKMYNQLATQRYIYIFLKMSYHQINQRF